MTKTASCIKNKDECSENFYFEPNGVGGCVSCNCSKVGSLSKQCNPNGECSCFKNFAGKQCDTCAKGFSGEHCQQGDKGMYQTFMIPIKA